MEAKILKIESISAPTTINAGGKEMAKRVAVMKELDNYGNAYAVSLLGEEAQKSLANGDLVSAVLKFSVREYDGRTYQDILVLAVEKIGDTVRF